jgi:hypothetical protein
VAITVPGPPQPGSIIAALQPQPDSKYICCGAAIIGPWHELQGLGPIAASGEAPGMMYCGIICDATGGHVGHGDGHIGAHGGGQAVAATGVAYVVAGGQQTGAGGGGHTGSRRNQLHGQHGHNARLGQHEAHPPNIVGSIATASKVSIFFMILCLLRKQLSNTAWVESANRPIQTLNGGQTGVGARNLSQE